MEKPVDKHAAVVYNTLENKEGRCIRLTSRFSKEVNSVIQTPAGSFMLFRGCQQRPRFYFGLEVLRY